MQCMDPLIFHYLLDPFGCTDKCFAIVRVDALRSSTSGDEALQASDELSGLKVWHKVYIHGMCKTASIQQDICFPFSFPAKSTPMTWKGVWPTVRSLGRFPGGGVV